MGKTIFFTSAHLGEKDLDHHILQLGNFICWIRHQEKEAAISTANPPVLQNPKEYNSYFHMIHLRKAPNPVWTFKSSGDLKVDFPELKQMTSVETAFQRYLDQACWKFVTKPLMT